MSDYKNQSFRLVDIGLDIRNVSDKVEQGKWTVLENVQSLQEGAIATRGGTTLQTTISVTGSVEDLTVHTLRRLSPVNVLLPNTVGSDVLLIGAGARLYRNTKDMNYSTGWSGNPLSVIPYRPRVSTNVWAYVADSTKMRKVNTDGIEYKWGISRPLTPALFDVEIVDGNRQTGNLNSSAAGASLYDWRYTYYSSATGAESNPSDTVSPGASLVGERAHVGVCGSKDEQVDQIRLYRRGGTNGTGKWRLSVTGPNETRIMIDNQADSAIALAELLAIDNDVPFTSVSGTVDTSSRGGEQTLLEVPMPYVCGPFIGKYMVACGDVNRPGHVYWTNPENPDASSPINNLQVTSPQEPLIGAFLYGSQPFVWTRDNLHKLDYGGPNAVPTFVPRKTACGKGICTPWAYAANGPMIFFASQDAIYVTDGESPAESLTEESIRPIFSGQTVAFLGDEAEGTFKPIDFEEPSAIRLHYVGQELHFIYKDTDGVRQHLIYHTLYKRWKSRSSNEIVTASLYGQENSAALKIFYGGEGGVVHVNASGAITDDGEDVTSRIRTGLMDHNLPHTLKEYGNILLDVDPGTDGLLVITPYILPKTDPFDPNAGAVPVVPTALPSYTVSTLLYGSGRQKIPFSLSDTYAYAIAFDMEWVGTVKIYQFELLWREDEEDITHWEFPHTSHGMLGWQHVRDAYITLRSDAVVTLSVNIDGQAEGYQIPSTEGEKRKMLVQLGPRKGKLFQYKLDSLERFRVYGEDCEVRVKSWNTALAYKLVTPFVKSLPGPISG